MADSLNILSMNVRGLGDAKKRRDVFNWLRDKNGAIYCLQDTHSIEKVERQWEAEWGYKAIFSSYKGDSRGSAILLNTNFDFKIHKTKVDPGGNFVMIDIECCQNLRLSLVNIYGPNKDNPNFYQNIKDMILDFQNASVVICGDWNLVQQYDMDCSGYLHRNNPHAREEVLNMKHNLELVDPWRENYPDVKRFTWRSGGGAIKQARLDYFLVSTDIYSQMKKT